MVTLNYKTIKTSQNLSQTLFPLVVYVLFFAIFDLVSLAHLCFTSQLLTWFSGFQVIIGGLFILINIKLALLFIINRERRLVQILLTRLIPHSDSAVKHETVLRQL